MMSHDIHGGFRDALDIGSVASGPGSTDEVQPTGEQFVECLYRHRHLLLSAAKLFILHVLLRFPIRLVFLRVSIQTRPLRFES